MNAFYLWPLIQTIVETFRWNVFTRLCVTYCATAQPDLILSLIFYFPNPLPRLVDGKQTQF